MGACYLVASICLKEAENDPSRKQLVRPIIPHILKEKENLTCQLGRVATAMFFLYYFFYGTSFAKVPWVYNSEVNSLGWRTRGAAAATATNWIGGFIVTQFTQVGVDNLHWRFYLSSFSPLFLLLIY